MIPVDEKIVKLEQSFAPSTLTKVQDAFLQQYNIELYVKRDDLLHPIISGNKWRKLKYIINHALTVKAERLVSMGGAYSNHLHALAYLGRQLAMPTAGIIRGEKPLQGNPTLDDLTRWHMQLHFIDRQRFRELRRFKRYDDVPAQRYQGYWIPEGGGADLALQGLTELGQEIDQGFDAVCLPCGTGTTLAGLLPVLKNTGQVIGFSVLKGGDFLSADIRALLPASASAPLPWQVNLDYHFGGFARSNSDLQAFIANFYNKTAIALDPVYTGKMFYGIYDLIRQGVFGSGQRLLAVHTGGLQGVRPGNDVTTA